MKREKTIQIGDVIYWNGGADIGKCDARGCEDAAFSYNENGQKFCEECLEDWHAEQDAMAESFDKDF